MYVFYFISWAWVIFLHVVEKKNNREQFFKWTTVLLLLIIGHSFIVQIGAVAVHGSYVILGVICVAYVSMQSKGEWKKYLLQSFCSAFGFSVMRCMEIYDPVLLFPNFLLIGTLVLLFLGVLLGKAKEGQVFLMAIGVFIGEGITMICLYPYGLYPELFSDEVADCLAVAITLFFLLHHITQLTYEKIKHTKVKG